ncbi:PorT family protein [Solitalea sp. MAHUQ-68]|uniref:PorT family protein n=1 Tax=Solitalea agri TaxID=2953739 RepID=A0A9X2F787_9SPHI|nr:outer membrane beta-barrel protein [Solitalea agri]MCO4293641.1 PorT family protein [Solitalea agri]
MEERFDKILSNHIRSVFDNYEDHSANEGWDQLLMQRQKANSKKKRIIPIWIWTVTGTAAILALFALNLDLANQKSIFTSPQLEVKIVKSKNISKSAKSLTKLHASIQLPKSKVKVEANNGRPNALTAPALEALALENIENAFVEELEKIPAVEINQLSQHISQHPDLNLVERSPIRALNNKIEIKPEFVKEYIAGETQQKRRRNIDYSVMAGSFMSYANGTENNGLGYKAGLDLNIPLTSRVQLNTGLNLGQQTLEFSGNNADLPASIAAKMNAYDDNPGVVSSPDSYKANMVAIDLPVNVRVAFPSANYTFFVSGGFSSYSYVNDSYSASYYSYPFGTGTGVRTRESLNIDNSGSLFSRIDWFRTLNMSAGIDCKLGKKQLSIEPYLKYPLGGLGADQIRWNSIGVNLKFSFWRQ